MMNQPASMAEILSLSEYEGMLWHWNESQRGDDDIEAPDPQITADRLARINADPRLTT